MDTLSIGEKITLLRNRKKLTKKDLAKNAGMHWTAITKYEHNHIVPSIEGLKKLAIALEVPSDYFLFDDYKLPTEIKDKELEQEMISADKLDNASRNALKSIISSYLQSHQKQEN